MIRCHRQHLIIFCCVFICRFASYSHERELGITFENRKLCKVYTVCLNRHHNDNSLCMNVRMMVSYRFATLVTPLNIYHPHQHYHLMYCDSRARAHFNDTFFFSTRRRLLFFFNFVHFFYSSSPSKMSFAFIFRISIARRGHANKHVNSGMRKIQRFLVS